MCGVSVCVVHGSRGQGDGGRTVKGEKMMKHNDSKRRWITDRTVNCISDNGARGLKGRRTNQPNRTTHTQPLVA